MKNTYTYQIRNLSKKIIFIYKILLIITRNKLILSSYFLQ